MSPSPPRETVDLFRSMSDVVYAGDDFARIHAALCEATRRVVPGCDRASLMLRDHDRFTTACATDDIAGTIDRMERELSEGPCVEAIEADLPYLEPALDEACRWPSLAERILAETSVRGMAGVQLRISDTKVGALNLLSDRPHALSEVSLHQAMVVASFASVALQAAHQREDARTLRAGLESNREIGKAIGLMMAFHGIDDQAAFGLLRQASMDMNLKMADVARQVVEHHNRR